MDTEVAVTAASSLGKPADNRDWKRPGADSPLKPHEGARPADTSTSDFPFLELGEDGCILSYHACGHLSQLPLETNVLVIQYILCIHIR